MGSTALVGRDRLGRGSARTRPDCVYRCLAAGSWGKPVTNAWMSNHRSELILYSHLFIFVDFSVWRTSSSAFEVYTFFLFDYSHSSIYVIFLLKKCKIFLNTFHNTKALHVWVFFTSNSNLIFYVLHTTWYTYILQNQAFLHFFSHCSLVLTITTFTIPSRGGVNQKSLGRQKHLGAPNLSVRLSSCPGWPLCILTQNKKDLWIRDSVEKKKM